MKFNIDFLFLSISIFIEINFKIISSLKYSDTWVLKLNASNIKEAKILANKHNFELLGQVGNLPSYYVFKSKVTGKKNREVIKRSAQIINSHPSVESFEREKSLIRNKRDFIEPPFKRHKLKKFEYKKRANEELGYNYKEDDYNVELRSPTEDPYWRYMWYLNRHNSDPKTPDMNVTAAWDMGYTGKGVVVTFLDDGLEWKHEDLKQNYDPIASYDINNNNPDPSPRYEETNENKHGTRCAGEVAAVANNSICSVGIAFNSGIGGIKILDGIITDSYEARALGFNPQHIDIYSASWGPRDNGKFVDGPGPLTKQVLKEGADNGRNGLGSIFVWASGNGGMKGDSCACDGYINNIYTISISSTSENHEKPWYLEECAAIFAATYSSGEEFYGEKDIITTDIRGQCTSKHTGTSIVPIAAGIIALALEANPKLTWRDIMYITVLTSRPHAIKSNNYVVNNRGLLVSTRYGFGLMDAGRMVEVAKDWVNVPKMRTCFVNDTDLKIKRNQETNSIQATLTTKACKGSLDEINYLEQVEIIVTIRAANRGLLKIYLTSPKGTKSMILSNRPLDKSSEGFNRWSFLSLQAWGENPAGDWLLEVTSADDSAVELTEYELILHGTKEEPVDYNKFISQINQK